MKPSHLPLVVVMTSLLPALALAAPSDKARKRPAAQPASDGASAVLKPFDKNENRQIDADELAAMQKSYAALRKLDRNSNGEIEQAEVDSLKAPATDDRKSRMLAGFKQVDKNGNHKIDPEEVAALQKMLSGGQMLSRLDQNGNGKLEAGEIDRLNQRLAQGIGSRRNGGTPATPSLRRPPEKAAEEAKSKETAKPEKKAAFPEAPAPEKKPPGNFGS